MPYRNATSNDTREDAMNSPFSTYVCESIQDQRKKMFRYFMGFGSDTTLEYMNHVLNRYALTAANRNRYNVVQRTRKQPILQRRPAVPRRQNNTVLLSQIIQRARNKRRRNNPPPRSLASILEDMVAYQRNGRAQNSRTNKGRRS